MKRRALIAIDLGDLHFLETYRMEACRGMLRYAHGAGNWELLFNDHHLSLQVAFRRLEDLPSLGVRGVLVCAWDRRKLEKARRIGLPLVSISNEYPQEEIACVLSDDEAIGRMAAEHLMASGLRSLGIVGSEKIPWDSARIRGFTRSASERQAAVTIFDAVHHSDPASKRAVLSGLSRWIKSLPKPAGVFCTDDLHASQLLDTAKSVGRRTPQDLAIVGVDNNTLICMSASPPLSSVEPNAEEVGFQAARLLDRMLGGGAVKPTPLLIPPRGVRARESSNIMMAIDPLVARAMAIIRERFAEPLGGSEIATALGVSRRTLEARFRSSLGYTVGERLLLRRLEVAKERLRVPGIAVNSIAKETGFGTTSHFCQRFKQATGMTPGEFRIAGKSSVRNSDT